MASKTLVLLEDDIDGGEASETLTFAVEGKSYIIDLSEKNASKFRKAVGPYVQAARRATTGGRSSTARPSQDYDPAAVRAWAVSTGHEVSTRGRVSAELVAAYRAAGN